ncbi:T9SS type A sorting domain-containing protein [bacterium]|nr:T9SS type A sorting domain-containing protein [bacterium]
MKKYLLLFAWGVLLPAAVSAQNPTRVITDGDIPRESRVTFDSDTTYILSGAVFVDSAAVLTIEPGTIIKAETGDGNQASALVVTRYGQIFAEGTADRPIIMTSVDDDFSGDIELPSNNPNEERKRGRGRWGGVVVLGRASTNNQTEGGLKEVEGINDIDPVRALYGGTEDDHNSGIIRYVSIRYTGINVGDAAGNEIQGLTLGGVGSGTTIEYVESYRSNDDGFEFFGGTVHTRYLASAFNADDSFDWDEGFRGKHQFWFAIQDRDFAGRTAEMDGATGDEFFTPFAIPHLSNVTYIGPGLNAAPNGDGDAMLKFRDNTGGFYYNSVFTEYDVGGDPVNGLPGTGFGVDVEDIDNTGAKTEDSRKRLEGGDLALRNNIWWSFGLGNTLDGIAPEASRQFVRDHLAANDNTIADPVLVGVDRDRGDQGLDPRLGPGSPALSGAMDLADPDFVKTSYLGAFSSGNNWLRGWTALDQLGYLGDVVSSVEEHVAEDGIPSTFDLSQNYPNPFNPSTSINYSVARSSHITLRVFNLIGQRVATLVDGVRQAGSYTVNWDASNLASGVYVYRLDTGDRVFSRRMLLLK